MYAQLSKQSPRFCRTSQDNSPADNPGRPERSPAQDHNTRRCSPPPPPASVYSELGLLDSKSRSLPLLDNRSDEEQSYRLSAPPHTPPRLSPKPVRQAMETTNSCSSHSLEHMSDSAVYHLAGKPGSPRTTETRSEQQIDSVYAEVPGEGVVGRYPHVNTFERMPGHVDAAGPKPNSNTYEPLEDIRPKHSASGFKVSYVIETLFIGKRHPPRVVFNVHPSISFTSCRMINGNGCSPRPRGSGEEVTSYRRQGSLIVLRHYSGPSKTHLFISISHGFTCL